MEFPPTIGGVGAYVYNLSKQLTARGNQVTVITPFRSKLEKKEESVENIKIIRVPYPPVYPFHASLLGYFTNRTFKEIEHKFDLVHVHTPIPIPIKTSLPIVTTVHTPMKIDGRYHEIDDLHSLAVKTQALYLYPHLESELFKSSHIISAVSKKVANELQEYGLDPNQIKVFGNGVDEKTFSPSSKKKTKEQYILFTGVLRARKGIFDFINSAQYISKAFPEVKFLVCGTGRLLNKALALTEKKGLTDKISFLGYVPKSRLIEIFQNATVQVLPSHYEGLPTVLLEAMSCGVPMVATDIGGTNEVIESGINGILVPPRSPESISTAVTGLLNNASLRGKIGLAARNTILKKYTWTTVSERIIDCYNQVIA
jgi:glycosyltransferase involved in cell wall biosynthesis